MKQFAIYELAFGQPYNFYNEEENKWYWDNPEKATLYNEEQAEEKRQELLNPRRKIYQETGEFYLEIHIGNLYKKNILK